MSRYVDTSKVTVRPISRAVARDFVVKYHYSHRFSQYSVAFGVYYEEETEHPFFDGENKRFIGVLVYGHPVCNKAVDSITCDDSLSSNAVLELTRLVILDGFGSNIESFCLGQSFRWFKQNAPEVKVLIAYSDPEYGHNGTIYQATNFYYQGIGASKLMPDYQVKLFPDSPWIPSRTVGEKFGPKNPQKLAERIGHKFWRKMESSKHRYIYFLCDKREKKEIMSKLKLPIVPYPKKGEKWIAPIEQLELVNGKVKITKVTEDDIT